MFLSPHGAIITIYVLISTSTLTTLLRCFVRKRIVQSFGVDDWFSLVAAIGFVGWMIICRVGLMYGIGQRRSDLSLHNAEMSFLLYWISYWAYGVVITLARLSIGFFFLRIIACRTHQLIIWANMCLNIAIGAAFLGVVIFQCNPISYFWKKVYDDEHGSCMSYVIYVKLGFAYSAICAACDIVFVFFPILLVRRLQMNKPKKLGVFLILGMASVAGACPLVRIKYLPDLLSQDFLHDTLGVAIWSGIEAGLAVTASNLATLRPLFGYVRSHISTSDSFRPEPSSARNSGIPPLKNGTDDDCIQLTSRSLDKAEPGQRTSFSQDVS